MSEQFDSRDSQYRSLLRSKDSDIQSLASRLEDQRRAGEVEGNRCRALTSQVSTFTHTEAELRSQLNIYVEKFKQVLMQPLLGSCGSWDSLWICPVTNTAQVEDTLNNSNDLFLTFRKEMEEMSKKTKRLEKENHTLNRKHEQTNRNILEMAEERTRNHEDLERWRRKCHHLEALCRRMQAQGRGEGLALAEGEDHLEGDDEGTESEYDDDYEDDEDGISEEEDPEPPLLRVNQPSEKPVFGPTPPPNLLEARANGNPVLNGCH